MVPVISNILYATDLSPNSAHALNHAVNLALRYKAKIVALHVIEEDPINMAMLEGYISQTQIDEYTARRESTSKARMKKRFRVLCEENFQDPAACIQTLARTEVCKGFPAEAILEKADEMNCDVIVMGTHGKGFLHQTFLGSVAKRVLRRSRKPVYIIPLPDQEGRLTFNDEEMEQEDLR